MDLDQQHLILYMGGCCGDLISALIDPTGCTIDTTNRKVKMSSSRQKLKKPFQFNNIDCKNQYIEKIFNRYLSIPSHDTEFHIAQKHPFIGIKTNNEDIAYWAASRFKQYQRPNRWKEIEQKFNISDTKQYAKMIVGYGYLLEAHTDKIIMLDDILNGYAIEKLKQISSSKYLSTSTIKNFYKKWLDTINIHSKCNINVKI